MVQCVADSGEKVDGGVEGDLPDFSDIRLHVRSLGVTDGV